MQKDSPSDDQDLGKRLPMQRHGCGESTRQVPSPKAITHLPHGGDESVLIFAEKSLAEDWLRPEEDDAWAHLQ